MATEIRAITAGRESNELPELDENDECTEIFSAEMMPPSFDDRTSPSLPAIEVPAEVPTVQGLALEALATEAPTRQGINLEATRQGASFEAPTRAFALPVSDPDPPTRSYAVVAPEPDPPTRPIPSIEPLVIPLPSVAPLLGRASSSSLPPPRPPLPSIPVPPPMVMPPAAQPPVAHLDFDDQTRVRLPSFEDRPEEDAQPILLQRRKSQPPSVTPPPAASAPASSPPAAGLRKTQGLLGRLLSLAVR